MKTYRGRVGGLLEHTGKFVVISGSDVLGIFDSYADALKYGYGKIGLRPFLVKKIEAVETTQRHTRDVGFKWRT